MDSSTRCWIPHSSHLIPATEWGDEQWAKKSIVYSNYHTSRNLISPVDSSSQHVSIDPHHSRHRYPANLGWEHAGYLLGLASPFLRCSCMVFYRSRLYSEICHTSRLLSTAVASPRKTFSKLLRLRITVHSPFV